MASTPFFVHERFAIACERHHEKTALVFQGKHISFSTWKQSIEDIAKQLKKEGIQPGDLVLVESPRSPLYLTLILAVMQCGAVFLPLDPNLPRQRKEWIKTHSKAPFHVLCNLPGERPVITRLEEGLSGFMAKEALYVMYTSGSSGTPKGVIGTHLGLLNRIDWMNKTFPIDPEETHLLKTAISFVDHLAEAFQALLSGAALVILPEDEVHNVPLFLDQLANYKISRLVVVPSKLQVILEMPDIPKLAYLKFVFSSGEVLPTSVAKLFCERFPDVRLINIYGSTEVSADATYYEVEFSIENRMKQLFQRDKDNIHFTEPNISLDTLSSQFPLQTPSYFGISLKEYTDAFQEKVVPFSIDVSHPRFIGHMTSGMPSAMGELSAQVAMLNQNTVKIETSKSLTFLERQVLATLHNLFYEYPSSFYEHCVQSPTNCLGVVLSGGTLANIQALHMAKHQALLNAGGDLERMKKGGFHKELYHLGYAGAAILGSSLVHYSMRKAASVLGLGDESILSVEVGTDHKIDLIDLTQKIEECKTQNILILALIGVAGTTEQGAIDPLLEIGKIASQQKIYFHVDAAWGGALMFSTQHKHKLAGIENADSITICGHKQLYTPLGTSVLLLKDPKTAFATAVHANYQAARGSHDLGQFSLLGSKPAQAVFLDAAMKIYGRSGYQYLIDRGCLMARHFAKIIQHNPSFELTSAPEINLLTYRFIPASLRHKHHLSKEEQQIITEATHMIQQEQFLKAASFVSYTTLRKDNQSIGVFRVVFANPHTSESDLIAVLEDQLTIASTLFNEPKQHLSLPVDLKWRPSSTPIGSPIQGAELFILDEENQLLSSGEIGQICIGGSVLSQGYLHDPERTQESFIPHPLNPKEKVYKTGDFGRVLPSSAIEYLGRKDQQVKVRGVRLDLIEIEQHILSIEAISQTCALSVDGELFAFYSLNKPLGVPLNHALKEKIPLYMIPSQFFLLENLPLLPNGKIDRQTLYQRCKRSQSKPERLRSQSPIETIHSICQSQLHHTALDFNTNFFDLGFTSLSINTLLIKLQEAGYPTLQLTDLYAHATIRHLAHFIEGGNESVPHSSSLNKRELMIKRRKTMTSSR